LKDKQDFLSSRITDRKIRYNYHDATVSRLEAVFARGDRRLGDAIEEAQKRGMRFDAWEETFDYGKWEEEDLIEFVRNLLNIAKPSLVIANKADLPGARENIERMQEKYPRVIPTSAESELALMNATRAGLISYISGDSSFEIIDESKLNANQIKALEYIQTNILDVYGSTGIQEALNTAVFDLLDMIVVYPVGDEHKLTDQKGNVLPDAFLVPKGSTPREFAYIIHTDIGDKFMHAVDARKSMRIASDYELQDRDIIKIVTH
jgi:ribosome-binding ATPase YchF (GTP1/OBG family)